MAIAREDGKPYPPSSISNILAGLYRYAKEFGDCPNFMSRKDAQFKELNGAISVKIQRASRSWSWCEC